MNVSLPIALPLRYAVPWRAALGALLAALALGGGWLWLRDSPLVAVRKVRISGLYGPQSAQIEELLSASAKRMTTMDFNVAALRSAVATFPVVAGLHVSTGFPHAVDIRVVERPPVATLLVGSERTALAADGVALGSQLASGSLPLVIGSFSPVPGERSSEAGVLAAASVLGAAPREIVRFVARAYTGPEGLTVAMRNGLLVYFGDSSRPHAKWLSLARVLAEPGSTGARYVDVRVPERPAAGLSSTSLTTTPITPSSAASPTAALAERLEQRVGGGAPAGATSTGQSPSAPSEASTGPSAGATSTGEALTGPSAGAASTGETSTGPSAGAASTGETSTGPSGASTGPSRSETSPSTAGESEPTG